MSCTHWGTPDSEDVILPACNRGLISASGRLVSASEFAQYEGVKSMCQRCVKLARHEAEKQAKQLAALPRTDSERYAELRALVEAWQTARSASERDRASIPPAVSASTANPTGQPEGWLARFMDTCAAETLLADWSHR